MHMMRYGLWAMERHAAELDRAGLLQDARVVEIVRHIMFARRLWLERVRDGVITAVPDDIQSFDEAMARCVDDTAAWVAWLESVSDDGLNETVTFTSIEGEQHTQPLASIAMHVVNHTTHHAHELGMILRSRGYRPPSTDYIVYARLHS
jgi:uncharacterized damage-inducible protein DinB